ncbi:polymeric immunoglobulin receptor-like [Myxocyprinus asiaticus]|uniref:polymeric immunoglobulin receptor-like n=1 Tax=Myxocyprinus asiaticus TaxID=70543 RepID=UPI002222164E|nr:polymeric immunoglobulin receptor-like [Myxocyprinus asiaticus]
MNTILTLTLLLIPGAVMSISVTGYSGGGVIITCRYNKEKTQNKKYFCRGQWSECKDLIRTDIKDEWTHEGRFSLYDDTRAAVFTVIIRDLNKQDSDKYYCGTDIFLIEDLYTEVNLNVREDGCCENFISLSAASGESVNISCRYSQSHRSDSKFVCRRSEADICAHETSVNESRRWTRERQLQLYDDRMNLVLTVSISNVTDSAEYWCGVQSHQQYKSFITRVKLTVTEQNFEKITHLPSSPLSSSSSSSSSSSIRTPPITLNSQPSTSDITSALTFSSKNPSLIISLSVVLALIIIGLLLLIVVLYKRHKSRGPAPVSKMSHLEPGQNEEVRHTACDNEDFKDIKLHNDSDTGRSADNNTAQILTNPSDSANVIYATPQFPTNPSHSLITIYSTVQHHTGCLESSVCETQRCRIASNEGVHYTEKHFQKGVP